MVDNVEDFVQGGGEPRVSCFSLNTSSNRCCYLMQRRGWLTLYGPGPGGFPGPGGELTDREDPMAEVG